MTEVVAWMLDAHVDIIFVTLGEFQSPSSKTSEPSVR